jgi:hypothetical protein
MGKDPTFTTRVLFSLLSVQHWLRNQPGFSQIALNSCDALMLVPWNLIN